MQDRVPSKQLRLKITTQIPSPYQVELFDALADRDDVSVEVLYWKGTVRHMFDAPSSTRHPSRVLKGISVPFPFLGWERLCPGIVLDVLAADYDVFVVSCVGPTSLIAMSLLAALRRNWVYWGERPRPSADGTVKARLKKLFWSAVGRMSKRVIGIGTLAVEEYRRLGIPEDRLANVPYSPDVSALLEPDEECIRAATSVRESLGEGDGTVFLYCGQLSRRKGVDVLLRAFEKCLRDAPNCKLVILGRGPEQPALEAMVPDELRPRIVFAGVKQRPELYHYYLAADVFAFPSRYDGWGVVVNEAMAAGLPVITTDQVGAAADMVVMGENGYIVPADDVQAFALSMIDIARYPRKRRDMAVAARETAAKFSSVAGAEKMVLALKRLIGDSVS